MTHIDYDDLVWPGVSPLCGSGFFISKKMEIGKESASLSGGIQSVNICRVLSLGESKWDQ